MFTVIDTKTGKYPNLEQIALKEDWAKNLIYCDMEGVLSERGRESYPRGRVRELCLSAAGQI